MIQSVHEFLAKPLVQSLIAEMLILCVAMSISLILILFVYDLISLLWEALRRRK